MKKVGRGENERVQRTELKAQRRIKDGVKTERNGK